MAARTAITLVVAVMLNGCASDQPDGAERSSPAEPASPLVLGEWFTVESTILAESRRVNVFIPTEYGRPLNAPLPVLYMPDGGLDEDFVHIAGLVQVMVSNGSMRPFMLVGIANTVRRRDMTGPTTDPADLAIAPTVGGSGSYRRFVREELVPAVRARYRTTAESAIVGESLAGLFVIETLLHDPALFDTYIAVDPSLWWDHDGLLREAQGQAVPPGLPRRRLFIANSNEPRIARLSEQFAGVCESRPELGIDCRHAFLADETHATVFHCGAMMAFGRVLGPTPRSP